MTMSDSSALTEKRDIDVCLNDGRSYVQGTQMIARAADALSDILGAKQVEFTAAAFRSITANTVAIARIKIEDPEAIASARFVVDDEDFEIGFYDTGRPAPLEKILPKCRYEHVSGDASDGAQVFQIENVAGLEDLLNAIVQSVKTVHSGLASDTSDIWFTGLRGARMSHEVTIDQARITLTRMRIMGKSPNWQTLTKVDFIGLDLPALIMSFSFKSASFQPAG